MALVTYNIVIERLPRSIRTHSHGERLSARALKESGRRSPRPPPSCPFGNRGGRPTVEVGGEKHGCITKPPLNDSSPSPHTLPPLHPPPPPPLEHRHLYPPSRPIKTPRTHIESVRMSTPDPRHPGPKALESAVAWRSAARRRAYTPREVEEALRYPLGVQERLGRGSASSLRCR